MTQIMPRSPGRTPKKVKYATVYASTNDAMHALLPSVPTALRELIEGLWREEEVQSNAGDGRTIRRIYRQAPNTEAIKILLDRTIGKSVVKVEHSGSVEVTNTLDLSQVSPRERLALLELAADQERQRIDNEVEGEVTSVVVTEVKAAPRGR